MFINDKMDLSQFYQLERLSISAVDNVRNIILPQSGCLHKLLISGEEIRLISNLEKQVNLDLLISYVVNSSSFNGINKIKSLKFLSIDLSSLNIDVGSLKNLEKLRLKNPGYKNIATVHNLDKLRELSIDGMKDSRFKGLALPKNLEKISIYDVKKGSLPKISNLPKLTDLSFLHIEDNILKNMANLPSLKELFGSDVDLPTLDGIDKLPSLVKVNLTNNGTVDISAVASLSNLEGLFVSENDLDNISVIAEMPWLKAVDVSFNRLMTLPKLKPGNNLRRIDFSDNPIEAISPEVLASYSSVRKGAYNTPFYQSLTHEQRRAF
ncbi:E3 ubiquitin-protein ligase SspH2 [Shewanella algae]|uniref:E3 ubiquitin-protein ligase SspH2 n=2 Tax=Shewanella algae TaxID=38313 RepID=A0A380C2M3_9GAMM|nr:E3 ubiquitin-protein ligase SspH2 [Shewanella algae]